MITPEYLSPGDQVGIVSTARKITSKELKPLIQLIENWGFEPVLGSSIGVSENQYAGSDQLRRTDFQGMMDNPNIRAIWCARGGYGTLRILDSLNFQAFLLRPKWIIGYSDVTVLHSHIHNLGIETLHGNMASDINKKTDYTRITIRKAIIGEDLEISYSSEGELLNRTGRSNGLLVGGNLSLLYGLCGSSTSLNTRDKILFIEDLDEYLYHIDRMMLNLKRNGMFENLKGMVVGGMSGMHDNNIPFGKSANEIVIDHVAEFNFPVCFNFPAGHIEDNRALILGREVELNVSKGSIKLSF